MITKNIRPLFSIMKEEKIVSLLLVIGIKRLSIIYLEMGYKSRNKYGYI
jgi:hypothetical protein